MATITLNSSLKSSANTILAVGSKTSNSLVKAQNEYKKYGNYIVSKQREIESIQFPNNKKLQELASINVINTFGSAGGLLQSLAGGALDLGGLIEGFFPGDRKKIGSKPNVKLGGSKPTLRDGKLRLGGVKALGIANAVFSGLDFATGLAEGESIGKSAAGTAGSLAGSLLGGAIGQTLIPIPGVGFVIGSAAGSFLGGFTGDRTYDAMSQEVSLKVKQEEKLKEQSKAQDAMKRGRVEKQDKIVEKFGGIVDMFEGFVGGIIGGAFSMASSLFGQEEDMDYGLNPDVIPEAPILPGEMQDMLAEGGELPSNTFTSPYGWRKGRLHSGVDYGKNTGTPISVIQPGIISYIGYDEKGYGNYIIVSHPGGLSSLYGHLSKVNVKENQPIEPGAVIGNVGSTGRSTGPHVHFEVRRGDARLPIKNNEGDRYFRFGGNVKVKPKPGSQVTSSSQTGVKPGQITSTAFGLQGSTSIRNYGAATKTNIKGFIIVPGHITGGGAPGEREAVEKIAKNIVNKLQKKYPGVPIRLWNNRNYPQTDAGFTKQMNDLKKLEDQGWEVIEIHMDASIESGKGTGRGVIVPYGATNLNEFDVRFASKYGSYDPKHRGGLGATVRGMTIAETGNIGQEALKAFKRGDQSAVDYFSSPIIQTFDSIIQSGKIGGGYRPPQSSVTPVAPRNIDVSYDLPYKNRPNTLIIDRPSVIASVGGGGNGGANNRVSIPVSSSQGTKVAIAVVNATTLLNRFQELALV